MSTAITGRTCDRCSGPLELTSMCGECGLWTTQRQFARQGGCCSRRAVDHHNVWPGEGYYPGDGFDMVEWICADSCWLTSNVAASGKVSAADLFADVVLGDREGVVCLAFARGPHRDAKTGRYAHREWQEDASTRYAWPAQRDELQRDAARELASGEPVDIYVAPLVRQRNAKRRRKGDAIPPQVLFLDFDDEPSDPELYARLVDGGSLVVASGSVGSLPNDNAKHRHVYLPLSRPVDLGTFNRLSPALAKRLGADHKFTDETVLRMPGTLNFKPTVPVDGEEAAPPASVEVIGHTPGTHDPDELAALLGITQPGDGSRRPEATSSADHEPIDVEDPPAVLPQHVQWALEHEDTDDRSAACWRVLTACVESGLTQGQALSVIAKYGPARQKHKTRARLKKEVARAYNKVTPTDPVDDETWQAFLNTFTEDTHPWMADNRAQWMADAMQRNPRKGFARHAIQAFLDVIRGRYSAQRAVALLTAGAEAAGATDADGVLRWALSKAMARAAEVTG